MQVLDKAYTADSYAGDEDNGAMAAWFVLSAIGLYSVDPGSADFVLGKPLFRHTRLHLEGGVLDVHAQRSEPAHPCAAPLTVLWNGERLSADSLTRQELMGGGKLEFHFCASWKAS